MNDQTSASYLVPIDRLRRVCAPEEIPYERSDEPAPSGAHPGQSRAIDALRFGLSIGQDGYNVFVLGQAGSDRHRLARQLAEEHAAPEEGPRDWCYVNNFLDPERPRALSFDAGKGSIFREDMRALIDEVRFAIPSAFEAEDYRTQRKSIESDTQHNLEALWKDLEQRAATENIGILQTPTGYVLAPMRDGKVLDEEDFNKLPDDERQKIQATIERLGEELQSHIEKLPALRKQHREQVKALNRRTTEHAVGILLAELKEKYAAQPEVVAYLDEVQADLVENARDFRKSENPMPPFQLGDEGTLFTQYEVNLVVSNKEGASAPVVQESNPTYSNIIGKIEYRAEMGTLVTDFSMIRGGGLLTANGGYLILDAERLLTRPFSWEALKRALFAKSVRIESPGETYGFVSTTTLRPEPIPLDIKIIVVGDRRLYYLLSNYDSEFSELFKVAADLDDDLERSKDNVGHLALVIADRVRERKLKPFSRDAVQRIIEFLARTAEDSERLSMHMRSLDDLLVQADYWARQRDVDLVDSEDVRRAIEQALRRLNRVQSRVVEAIERDNLLIDTSGSQIGQVNGLTVTDLGEFRFGHPVRITATTRIGSGEVIDIEREVELGGAIHSKGMLILSSALSVRYATDVPLSLRGSVVFEQTYGGVDGDSASVAELCALLSSLSGVPIRQNLAVTGSINQRGRVQVVGGVNEKIEGFFDICSRRGLDGSHGVVIPSDNVKHLMLREEVVEAVDAGRFSVHAVSDIDEAISVLTGVDAGERDTEGNFPPGSVNQRVETQLLDYAALREQYGKRGDSSDDD